MSEHSAEGIDVLASVLDHDNGRSFSGGFKQIGHGIAGDVTKGKHDVRNEGKHLFTEALALGGTLKDEKVREMRRRSAVISGGVVVYLGYIGEWRSDGLHGIFDVLSETVFLVCGIEADHSQGNGIPGRVAGQSVAYHLDGPITASGAVGHDPRANFDAALHGRLQEAPQLGLDDFSGLIFGPLTGHSMLTEIVHAVHGLLVLRTAVGLSCGHN
mmetsp:Transcript_37592/g.49869  ORF Transcript_37592/g.49869 Transcript_37592/m.49869 type:complete len:214 (-) Transcript_37592:174-815(-)